MASRRHFGLGLALRLLILGGSVAALLYTFGREGLVAPRIVAAALCAGSFVALLRFIERANLETARFVEALNFGDFSQAFSDRYAGAGATQLGEALEAAMKRLRAERAQLSEESRFLAVLVDEAPTALLVIDREERVELSNKAARHMFGGRTGILVADLEPYGQEFIATLRSVRPGEKRLTRVLIDDLPQQAMVGVSGVQRLGYAVRVVTVQPIQRELNAVEAAAQTDLVRVLTHEIMNSMTPVTSLANTAATLMRAVDRHDDPSFADARIAVETLAARAEGIMHFVESYRQFSRGTVVRPSRFEARGWVDDLRRLFEATQKPSQIRLDTAVEPTDLCLHADRELLSQVALNLLKNAAEAGTGPNKERIVQLSVEQTSAGRRLIRIEDNGPGIDANVRDDIFLPFFTTKASGTGVGLSLARQIIIAHGGAITVESEPGSGARFSIVL
jgi:nitrogen fixation/metabolism regulation signal transduction histidine kinase